MPEGVEVEIWTRAARRLVGGVISEVWVDPRCGGEGASELCGAQVLSVKRRAKTMVITTDRALLGVHFGMTGRLVIGDWSPIASLEYGSDRDLAAWDRCRIVMVDQTLVRVNDPRRWSRYQVVGGGPEVPAATEGLWGPFGPDAMEITADQLAAALAGSSRSIKACALDQRCISGLGNMCVDEVLWRSGIDPQSPAGALDRTIIEHLAEVMRTTLAELLQAGGSHRGQISPALRRAGGLCPRDATPLRSTRIAGRTTWWCPRHQM